MSQLELAARAGVSARHLSFVETGRAQPSLDMVSRLAETLTIPLRERNVLYLAAGYAPVHRETGLASPGMGHVRRAIDLILRQQEPYPAFVVNRHWDLLASNQATSRVFGFLRGGPRRYTNIMRTVFAPDGIRPLIANWEEVAGGLMTYLHNDVATAPSDAVARDLLRDVLAYPGVPLRWKSRNIDAQVPPLLTVVYRKADVALRFFSTISTFGTPHDVTLDELRIECTFPADEATERTCRKLAANSGRE